MRRIGIVLGLIVGLALSLGIRCEQVFALENIEDDSDIVYESTIDDAEEISEYVDIMPDDDEALEVYSDSVVEVNPIYEDIITEEELSELIDANRTDEEEKPAGLFFTTSSQIYTSIEEIGAYLKTLEIERDTSGIELQVSFPVTFENGSDAKKYLSQAVSIAEQHTGVGSEGDYLRFNRLGQEIKYSYTKQDERINIIKATYTFSHFTTLEQEEEITECLNNQVYPSLSLDDKTAAGKIFAIYGYITDRVSYDWENLDDNSNLLKHSAYAALINGTAVCQGYATLLYRMLLDAGIDCRVITSRDHAWNIAGLEGAYYNLDSTWDSDYGNEPELWKYYLKGSNDFSRHSRASEYLTDDFMSRYPMSEDNYDWQKEDDPDPGVKNGLEQGEDGNWYLFRDGNIDYSYSALYGDEKYGWWLVENGQVNFGYNDLYYDVNCGWWKIAGGTVDFGYSDLYYSPTCGWWKISEGTVDFGYTDLYNSPTCGWWKITEGYVDFGYTDLYCSPTCGWWKITEGYVDFGYTDLYYSPTCGWWKVNEGYVDFGYNDLYCSPTCGWWLVSGGAVDFGYSDIFISSVYGNWKVATGCVDFGYNGVYNSQRYGQCYVRGGQAQLK